MTDSNHGRLRAGAALQDITPPLGTALAGSLTRRFANCIRDPLHARAVVLEAGATRLAFVLLDVIALPNDDAERMRQAISAAAGMPVEHICVSCTHTHSGPEMIGNIFGSQPDGAYLKLLTERAAEAARLAAAALQPARAAWAIGHEPRPAFNRRYHMRGGGATMNPGHLNSDVVRPAGPTDPGFPLLMIETTAGRPLAAVANFSLHYIGDHDHLSISSDYFGRFSEQLCERYGNEFVGILTHGASGDINNIDVSREAEQLEPGAKSRRVAGWLVDQVAALWQAATFTDALTLGATQATYPLRVRKPLADGTVPRAAWQGQEWPQFVETYLKERLALLEWSDTVPMGVQALRVGEFAAATMTGEIFCRFGIDLKQASPFEVTALIELANGYGGYVPTQTDYVLGGYETWLARSAYAAPGSGEEMVALAAGLLQELRT